MRRQDQYCWHIFYFYRWYGFLCKTKPDGISAITPGWIWPFGSLTPEPALGRIFHTGNGCANSVNAGRFDFFAVSLKGFLMPSVPVTIKVPNIPAPEKAGYPPLPEALHRIRTAYHCLPELRYHTQRHLRQISRS